MSRSRFRNDQNNTDSTKPVEDVATDPIEPSRDDFEVEKAEAAKKRAAAAAGGLDPQVAQYLAALKVERLGYERRGRADRVALVDAEIDRITKNA